MTNPMMLGGAVLVFLMVVYYFMVRAPRPAQPKKSAITNPAWATFTCPDCGHQDGNTADVVRCVNCSFILLRYKR